MLKKPVSGQTEKESLVPVVEQEEGKLRQSLDQARLEARRIVEDAQREAAEKVRRARAELPALMERRRAEMLETHRAEAAVLRGELAAQTRELLSRARQNLADAAAFIVSLVWPGGRS